MKLFKLLKIFSFLYNHPFNKSTRLVSIFRFIKWQIISRLWDEKIVYKFTENSKLLLARGMAGATANYYCGLADFSEMSFLLHFLRKEDLFIDVGSNIGSYTILASGELGAKTISIEPIPSTYNHLYENICLNNLNGIAMCMNIGLGSDKGILMFTSNVDSMNHVDVSNDNSSIQVSIETLDSIVNINDVPALVKIDVEGYEMQVLKGSCETLKNDKLKAIIIELNGLSKRYAQNDKSIHEFLISYNFLPYVYEPSTKSINEIEIDFKLTSSLNVIYMRDLNFIKNRIALSRKFSIGPNNYSI